MRLPSSVRFLLFDMDGTLVNTEPIGPQTFLAQLTKYGITPTDEEQELFSRIWRRDGTDIKQDDWLLEIAQKYDITLASEEYLKEFYDLYKAAVISGQVLPGAEKFLSQAKDRYKLGLVTASKRSQVEAIIDHHGWQDVFDTVVTSEDFVNPKPNPESFEVGMKNLGAEPGETTVFEDSKNGSKAGAAAGCYVVGVRAGNEKEQDLSAATVVVDTFEDIVL